MQLTGVFAGPIAGLRYRTPSCAGATDAKGQFSYRQGERITFLLGEQAIGTAIAGPRIDLAQLVSRVDGNLHKLFDPGLTNLARFICSLDQKGNFDGGVVIAPEVHHIIGRHPINFRGDVSFAARVDDQVRAFEADPAISAILGELELGGAFTARMPRLLCSAAAARNEVRRNILGIQRYRDIRVPLRNGSYVLADVFRPEREGKFPVVMNCGVYGRAFHHHTICNDADHEAHEAEEDAYHNGNPEGLIFENHETVNTVDWVPNGYVVMRVDGPGSGRNPGRLAPWGFATAEAYRDAIEWAGEQPWSNGNVGLWGMSYYAMTQQQVASLQPRHLKAMIGIGTDVDMYEEVAYTGGILNQEFFPVWFKAGVLSAVCGEPNAVDFLRIMSGAAFKDSDPAMIFSARSEVLMSPDMSGVAVPSWIVACATHPAHFHQLGSSEAYLLTNTPHKKLDFWEDWFTKSYSRAVVADHMSFFDHWLKEVDNGIMDRAPVRLEIRTGDGCSYLQEEQEWPIARTSYTRWFLDAALSDWSADEHRAEFLRLTQQEPAQERRADYSAEVSIEARSGPSPALLPVKPPEALLAWQSGISFVSEPVSEDMVIAGYSMARLWVSSTSEDMDIFIGLRVLDQQDREVNYTGPVTMGMSTSHYPLAKGWLRVSHRKRDEARCTEYTVKHTHLKADHAPLKPGEVVPVEVEIIPTAALIRKGWRLRVDIQPYDGYDHGSRHEYAATFHDGARNVIYTGPDHLSHIQLPLVPDRRH